MGKIEGIKIMTPRVGVATSSGRAYYRISSLLKRAGLPFSDILFTESRKKLQPMPKLEEAYRLIITTRKEKLQLDGPNIICEEDLGEDAGLAKEKLISLLYPLKSDDMFVLGIDPGERTGVAAFINHREIESSVFTTHEATLRRVFALIDNAPDVKKIVKIGSGSLYRALRIASIVDARYGKSLEIHLVNESGTSVLKRKGKLRGTRDERAARLIAFRGGARYL